MSAVRAPATVNPVAACLDYSTPSGLSRRASRIRMVDSLLGVVAFIFRAINFVLDLAISIARMKRFARWITGSDAIVEVPPESTFLPPAAQRALAEAEARHDGASFIDKYFSPSCK